MPRQPIQSDYTTFNKGLITEASPLTFPENASLEEVNFVLNPDGSRSRRLGIEYEIDYNLIDTGVDVTATDAAVSSLTWTAVANSGDLEFVVVQIGNDLYFYDSNLGAISNNPRNGGTKITISGDPTEPIAGASIYGKFVIAHGTQEVTILSYDAASDTVTATEDRLKVRDLFGVDDGLEVDERPTTLSVEHQYNLRNQGWPVSIKCSNTGFDGATDEDPINFTFTRRGWYPSNADIVWAAKLSNAKDIPAIGAFWPAELDKIVFGSTQAPLGRYVIDLFNRGASRVAESGIALTDDDQSLGGVTSVAAFAGRVFYSVEETSRIETDNRSPNIGTMIFYSRADNSLKSFTKCYAEADPASEHVFDPVATDGGFITIPEAGQVLRLVTMGQSLFVFCTNGVWEIHGGEESFSALNQSVSKTTDIGVASPRSIVYAEDKIAYWGLSGIYLITRNDLTLRGGTNDLTYATIQTFFDDISFEAKEKAVGRYDPFIRTFRWLYRDDPLPNPSFFNKELIFDINLGAFYVFNIDIISEGQPFISDFVSINSILLTTEDNQVIVTDTEEQDVVIGVDDVIIKSVVGSGVQKNATKYLTVVKVGTTHKFTFSHYRNSEYRDWYTYNGVGIDAAAKMVTGYIVGNSAMTDKKVNYIHVYLKRTESGLDDNDEMIDPSSCTMQAQWQWTNSSTAGRWGPEFEVYRLPRIFSFDQLGSDFDYGYTTVVTKNKLRGHGRVVSLLFKTKPYHNCILYGWSVLGSEKVA